MPFHQCCCRSARREVHCHRRGGVRKLPRAFGRDMAGRALCAARHPCIEHRGRPYPAGQSQGARERLPRLPLRIIQARSVRHPCNDGGGPPARLVRARSVQRAAAAGATITMPVSDQFWGDRSGCLQDPFGHLWMISTHIEDVSEEEMAKRAAQMFGQ